MTQRSIFDRGGSGMTTGGLDRYLGPEAQDYSSLPEHIEDAEKVTDAREVDCEKNKDEPVCQIARAEQEIHGKDAAT